MANLPDLGKPTRNPHGEHWLDRPRCGGAQGRTPRMQRAMERSRRHVQEENQKSKIEREWVGRKDKEPGV